MNPIAIVKGIGKESVEEYYCPVCNRYLGNDWNMQIPNVKRCLCGADISWIYISKGEDKMA